MVLTLTHFTALYDEITYSDPSVNSNKFYRAWVVENTSTNEFWVVFNWGRIGANGQYSSAQGPYTNANAFHVADGKLNSKRRKGYGGDVRRTLAYCPDDVLEKITDPSVDNARSRPDGIAAAGQAVDLITVMFTDIDTCRRLAMGGPDDVTKAIIMRKSLAEQLDALRDSVTEAEGQAEVVDMLIGAKLS